MKKLIFEGAEAKTFLVKFNGKKAVEKERTIKKYRETKLDEKIRKERMKSEVNLIHKAKFAGIRTPIIYRIDYNKNSILMEWLNAKKIKDKINLMEKKDFIETGKQISLLHLNSIVHGDLTSNNILIKKRKIFFIDFGLGFNSHKIEDFAVDLLGFKKTFLASYPGKKQKWNWIKQGYMKWHKGKEVLKRINEVEKRKRYL